MAIEKASGGHRLRPKKVGSVIGQWPQIGRVEASAAALWCSGDSDPNSDSDSHWH